MTIIHKPNQTIVVADHDLDPDVFVERRLVSVSDVGTSDINTCPLCTSLQETN